MEVRKGDIILAKHSGPVSMLKWCDKKINGTMILTCHGDEMRNVKTKPEEEKEKPVSFLDYNPNMIGVDLKDQLLHTNLLERKKMTK